MIESEKSTVVSSEQARGGEKKGVVRYVLGVSVFLAVLAMIVIGVTAT